MMKPHPGLKSKAGVIWIQTFILPQKHEEKQLDVLLENYADSLAGTGYYTEGNIYSLLQSKERKYATKVVQKQDVTLGPHSAIRGTIEIVDIDQQKFNPDAPGDKLEVVLSKVAYNGIVYDPINQTYVQKTGKAVILFGYINSASYFEKYLDDFDAFIKMAKFFAPKPK